jgi:hypothetical protein
VTLRKCALRGALLAFSVVTAAPAAAQISIGYPGPYGGAYDLTSSMRLQVTPRDADVFVDGYYAGKVDEFDGTFQRLRVEPGEHEIQLFFPGHRIYTQKVYLQPGNTFNVRHTMVRLAPGEAEPERPIGTAPSRISQGTRSPQAPPRPTDGASRDRSGAVTIRVLPADAVVLIDGQRWDPRGGETVTVQVDAGLHTIEVRKNGYRGYLTEITVEPGKTLPLNISLAPE